MPRPSRSSCVENIHVVSVRERNYKEIIYSNLIDLAFVSGKQ
jgi:hypothetical protein